MALVTVPTQAMPVSGDDINAENVTNWMTNFRTFLDEGGNFDEANADLTGTDGLVGKSTAQTISGLKSLENTSAAAVGILSSLELGVNPSSGTVTAGDGSRIVFYGDDSGGNKTTLGEVRVPWVTVTDGATEAANLELLVRIAGAVTEVVSVGTDGFILNETGVDLDYRFETDTNANAFTINSGLFGGVGGIGLGAAATAVGVVLIDPPALTADANTNIARLNIENTAAITVPAGTTSVAASVFIGEPNLTTTGTITSAVSLYIEAAPTEGGTNNYALWVDSGVSAFGGNAVPDANDAGALGTTTLGWSDLHLATGGLINWANGEITITETDANTLTIAGVATRVDLAAGILEMNSQIEWDTGVAVTATEYSVGRDADGTNQLHFNVPTGATFEWSVNDVSKMTLTGAPILFVNDTSNANMTTGITINQGSATNEIFALKNSGLAHGFTDLAEADTFLSIIPASGEGGVAFLGYNVGTVANRAGIDFYGRHGGTPDTTDTSSSVGVIRCSAQKRSAANIADLAATENGFSISMGGGCRFLGKGNGDFHITNTTLTVLDDIPDALVMRAGRAALAPEGTWLHDEFVDLIKQYASVLEERRIMFFERDETGRVVGAMNNIMPSIMLAWDGLYQQYQEIRAMKSQINQLLERTK